MIHKTSTVYWLAVSVGRFRWSQAAGGHHIIVDVEWQYQKIPPKQRIFLWFTPINRCPHEKGAPWTKRPSIFCAHRASTVHLFLKNGGFLHKKALRASLQHQR